MKALFKAAPQPGALEIREVARPEPRADEVVIDVAGASICGSDLHIVHWHPMAQWTSTPVILGHEFGGFVREVGSEVTGFKAGDAVAAESVIWCGRCPRCREGKTNVCDERRLFGIHAPGGLAQAVAVPERLLHRLPDGMPAEHAALAEPTTVALHAVLLQPPKPGDTVLVTGPGPIGLLAGRIARAFGARVLISGTPADTAARLPAARELGLEPLDPSLPLQEAIHAPVDLVLESSGAGAALDAALHVVKRGGGITLIGMPSRNIELDLAQALRGEIALRASYFGTWHDFHRALDLIADGTVPAEALLAPYPLDDALRAIDDAAAQRVLKPLVRP
ncbi:MAG TPA: alcohol dehydrogenase catalytic domain-containing protein [Chloroflexota bacterium]